MNEEQNENINPLPACVQAIGDLKVELERLKGQVAELQAQVLALCSVPEDKLEYGNLRRA